MNYVSVKSYASSAKQEKEGNKQLPPDVAPCFLTRKSTFTAVLHQLAGAMKPMDSRKAQEEII